MNFEVVVYSGILIGSLVAEKIECSWASKVHSKRFPVPASTFPATAQIVCRHLSLEIFIKPGLQSRGFSGYGCTKVRVVQNSDLNYFLTDERHSRFLV